MFVEEKHFYFVFIIISCAESGEAGACVTGNWQERLPTVLIHLEIVNISETPLSFKTRWSQRFLTATGPIKVPDYPLPWSTWWSWRLWLSIVLIHLVIMKTLTIHCPDTPGDHEDSDYPLSWFTRRSWSLWTIVPLVLLCLETIRTPDSILS